MTLPAKPELAELLYSALAAPVGILCQASDPALARQRLYAARKGLGDPALDCLQIRLVQAEGLDGNLAIVKGERK